jgi:hypothetical protein
MASSQACEHGIVLFQNRIHETASGNAQQKKKFAGPQKNVQQAASLKIIDVVAVQGHIQSLPRALLDERPQRSEIEIRAIHLLAAGINTSQIFVAEIDEVVQTKILLSQGSHSSPFTKIHCADLVFKHF